MRSVSISVRRLGGSHLIADSERAFNTNDADLLVEHFADNGTGVGVTGTVLSGRDDIGETSRELLNGPLRDQFARYTVEEVRFLRPDVAVCRKLATATDANGNDIDVGPAMVAHYVLVKQDGRWWITLRQNTLIAT